MSARSLRIDPQKPFFIYDSYGDWMATILNGSIFDSRGDYVGFIRGDQYDVYTTSGEWIGNIWHDGRIVRRRSAPRQPLLKDLPPKPAKPANLPARAPLPGQTADLGYERIDVLEEDPGVFRRLSDLTPDVE